MSLEAHKAYLNQSDECQRAIGLAVMKLIPLVNGELDKLRTFWDRLPEFEKSLLHSPFSSPAPDVVLAQKLVSPCAPDEHHPGTFSSEKCPPGFGSGCEARAQGIRGGRSSSIVHAMSNEPRYVVHDRDGMLAARKPMKDEYYGWCWLVVREGDQNAYGPAVIVPDSGDGSAAALAESIAALLDSGELPQPGLQSEAGRQPVPQPSGSTPAP